MKSGGKRVRERETVQVTTVTTTIYRPHVHVVIIWCIASIILLCYSLHSTCRGTRVYVRIRVYHYNTCTRIAGGNKGEPASETPHDEERTLASVSPPAVRTCYISRANVAYAYLRTYVII